MKMKMKSRIATGLATFSLIAVSLVIGGEIRVKFEGTGTLGRSPVKKVDGRY
jgi:hypothetical protein